MPKSWSISYVKSFGHLLIAYEWHDKAGQWWRSYGNENWEFDEHGLMKVRFASINDLAIEEGDRKLTWDGAVRPDDFSGLSEMGL